MIEKSENITNLAAALLKAQKEMGSALKDSQNPYFKSDYANMAAIINAVKEPLNNNGITFLQAVNGDFEHEPTVETMLLHESGQFLCSRTPVFCAKPKDPQAFGSGITYSKRYALQAILGLPTKDDDAEAAMGRNKKNQKKNEASKPKEKQQEIVDQAFFDFTTVHKDALANGFVFNKEKFTEAIIKHFKHLPTNKASIKKILKDVKPEEIIVETQPELPEWEE